MPRGGNRATAAPDLQPLAALACAIMGAIEASTLSKSAARCVFADREGRSATAEGQEHP